MPRDSNGNTQPLGGTIVSTGDPILPSQHNPALVDLYEMMSQSLSRDGQGGMRANLNMNGYRIINVATSSASGDLATVGLVNSTVDTKVNAAVANKVTGDFVSVVGLDGNNPSSPYVRRKSNNQVVYLQPSLGFTPIQQGGGTGQGNNKIRIGWGSAGVLLLQVDNVNFSNTWPINISGTASSVSRGVVYNHMATQTANEVGTVAILKAKSDPGGTIPVNGTVSGSMLKPVDGYSFGGSGGYSVWQPTGTWRYLGPSYNAASSSSRIAGLFVKVS